MKSFSSKEIIKMLEDDGWYLVHSVGSHCQYKHKEKKGKVTVPHPKKDLPQKTVKSILKQAGIQLD
ncbi:TPA: type II toxin-antitoxin system HicA family toxin [Bacillus cereus]|uniref:type II toxin-antitoxin system HicA family toxin n=1 Tax=Bacillus TaxID=1386 RepID=UPI000BF8A864|nr:MULTISPECIES: type II toxin-antitoxin system HicA family toxin [Bacillus]MCA1002807.1 type II toxin-antitoxin system HicA family toxin [Bacillus thuringiensis]MCH5460917.1 type II toxin-antitoxin system HicA family toxin [Bacillus cereus]PFU70369.1 addiction module toxin, HicA family [Bacillus thuringiensis]RKN53557.1 type II toxin-antitoxin system HicA family toxin [Bacillus sp. S66]HDR8128244.1 type II toxin-antitoxin system HicA family toxin [Bacillus cereus]